MPHTASWHAMCIQPRRMRLVPGTSLDGLAKEFYQRFKEHRVLNSAAALAFYSTLAIFPALIFLLSVLPYLPIEHLQQAVTDLIGQAMPGAAAKTLTSVVESLIKPRGGLLSFSFLGTLVVASSGMRAVITQLNITHDVKEERSVVKARAVALLLTILSGVLTVLAFALVVLGGYLQSFIGSRLGWSDTLLAIFATFRWVVIVLALLVGFAAIYYLGPHVERRRFKGVLPGAVLGVVALILAALGFRLYVENFGRYDATYGSIGAMIVLMLWLYVSSLSLLIGSEVNALYEKHERRV